MICHSQMPVSLSYGTCLASCIFWESPYPPHSRPCGNPGRRIAMTDRLTMDAHGHGHDRALLSARYSFTEITSALCPLPSAFSFLTPPIPNPAALDAGQVWETILGTGYPDCPGFRRRRRRLRRSGDRARLPPVRQLNPYR